MLVTEFLDIEKIRSSKIDAAEVDLVTVMRDAQREFGHQAHARQQTLTFRAPDTPVLIEADVFQIQEALNNLLSNAIKYTPPGGTICVGLEDANDCARVTVTDTGIGIPVEEQPKIFQPFFRVRSIETAQIQGTGLGLSLVRAIVDVHQGAIQMDSVPGKGTTFTIRLPKKPSV
jgi:signal transduction histidine kinase